MQYYVTFETFGAVGTRGPVAIDVPNRHWTLADALAHARGLIDEGRDNVAISDGQGHSITGADLLACCRDEKTLTDDLRAVPK